MTFEGVRVMPYEDDGADGYEDDGALGVEPTLRSIGFHDRHRALPVEAAPAMDDLDAGPPQIGDNVAIDEVFDDHVSLVEHRLDVHAVARHDLSHSRNRFGELKDLDGADQRLGRCTPSSGIPRRPAGLR